MWGTCIECRRKHKHINTVTIFLDKNAVNIEGDFLVQGMVYAVDCWVFTIDVIYPSISYVQR